MEFVSLEVAPYHYNSTMSYMAYCCHVWGGAPSCYLDMLDKLQRWICRTAGPSLAASLEPLAHPRNLVSLSLFYTYYFGRCSPELAKLIPFLYSRGKFTWYSKRLHNFSIAILRCFKGVTAILWNYLPTEGFPFTYELTGFNSGVRRHTLSWVLSQHLYCMLFIFFLFFFYLHVL